MNTNATAAPWYVTGRTPALPALHKVRRTRTRRLKDANRPPQSAPRVCYVWINGVSMPVPLE